MLYILIVISSFVVIGRVYCSLVYCSLRYFLSSFPLVHRGSVADPLCLALVEFSLDDVSMFEELFWMHH